MSALLLGAALSHNHAMTSNDMIPTGIKDGDASFPGPRDVLFGRGHSIYNHHGNRVFRRFVDLHLDGYLHAPHRKLKSHLVCKVLNDLMQSGYRFMKYDTAKKQWEELAYHLAKKKVGHALRDRSPIFHQIRLELPMEVTYNELDNGEMFGALRFAERTTDPVKSVPKDVIRVPKKLRDGIFDADLDMIPGGMVGALPSIPHQSQARAAMLAAAARKNSTTQSENAETAASVLLNLRGASSEMMMSQKRETETSNKTSAAALVGHQPRWGEANKPRPAAASNESESQRSINSIVIAAMQNAHGTLPLKGKWKFFPLSGAEPVVNLRGPPEDWKLVLRPVDNQGMDGANATIALDINGNK